MARDAECTMGAVLLLGPPDCGKSVVGAAALAVNTCATQEHTMAVLDTNKDGAVDRDEFKAAVATPAATAVDAPAATVDSNLLSKEHFFV